ncbi:MAG: TetR/AcrR family transcriptional regulator [Actinobacteria bacterium]|nr:TetR/AcrR family transcriptional regulator [Actinomycetota bacterium]
MVERGESTGNEVAREPGKSGTRQRLLHAAAEVIARDGLQAASLMEIAREAGVTTGAIYSSFKGKEELLFAVVEEFTPRLSGSSLTGDSSEGSAAISSIVELARSAAHYSDDAKSRRLLQLQLEFFSLALREPRVLETFATMVSDSDKAVADLLEQTASRLPESPPPRPTSEQGAVAIIAALQGLMQRRLLGRDHLPDAVFEWTAYVIAKALFDPASS